MTKPNGDKLAVLAAGVIGAAIVGIVTCIGIIFNTVED